MKTLTIYFYIFLLGLTACTKQSLPKVMTVATDDFNTNSLNDTVTVELERNKSYCITPHAAIKFTYSLLGNYKNWAWMPGGDSISKTKIINQQGNYQLLLWSSKNIADTISFFVGKCDSTSKFQTITFYIPNVFTPNGDGKNDTWSPKGTAIASIYYEVRNEDGILVFSSTSIKSPWDGTWQGAGKIGPSGTYLYYVEYTDTKGVFTKFTGALQMQR